tara:strand:- start:164 stop:1108 length:945 start_codon:yes stop_codon:yes gene_type:complete
MKLSFLIQLLLLIILIVGVYLVATNSITGRTKLIAIVFLVVVGIYLFNALPFFQNYNEIVSDPQDARLQYEIAASELKPTDGQFTLSAWVYIEDWNTRYGEEKVILKKNVPGSTTNVPKIYFDAYKNDLKIKLDVMTESLSDFQNSMYEKLEELKVSLVGINASDLTCSGDFIYDNRSGDFVKNDGENISCSNVTEQEVVIENIPLQKWNHFAVAANTRTMDVYLNGKLVRSQAFNNVINTGDFNSGGITVTPNGGFGGFISKVQYYNYFITPQEAYNIYRGGFGDVFASALNKYNMSVTFYEDAVERKKYWVF